MTAGESSRTVDVGGLRLAYRDLGDRAGHPVVLLHGMSSRGATWDRFAAELAAAGRRVVVPDLRGHGDSGRAASYPFGGFRDDVTGLLDRLGLDGVDLVGHSLGGHVAMLVAQRRPDRVRRLVVEDAPPPPRAPRTGRGVSRLRSVLMMVGGIGRAGAFDRSMTRPVLAQFRAPDPDWWDRLATVVAPTLLLHGGPRSHVRADDLDAVARALPDGRVVTVPVGHRIHSLRPDLFRAEVAPFLLAG